MTRQQRRHAERAAKRSPKLSTVAYAFTDGVGWTVLNRKQRRTMAAHVRRRLPPPKSGLRAAAHESRKHFEKTRERAAEAGQLEVFIHSAGRWARR